MCETAECNGTEICWTESAGFVVDSRLKEYTTGSPHELTDRLFVVRRAFRVNDALPAEMAALARDGSGSAAAGRWSTGLPVESRNSTCRSTIPSIRAPSWYRDYIGLLRRFGRGQESFTPSWRRWGGEKPILKKDVGGRRREATIPTRSAQLRYGSGGRCG